MEVKKENVVEALKKASPEIREVFYNIFPEVKGDVENKSVVDKRPVTERIQTFQDAIDELGLKHPYVSMYEDFVYTIKDAPGDLIAYLKLRIIVTALNEGWIPTYTSSEIRYYPSFSLITEDEKNDVAGENDEKDIIYLPIREDYETDCDYIAYRYSSTISNGYAAGIFPFPNGELAEYCGKQFLRLWANLLLHEKGEAELLKIGKSDYEELL